MQWVKTGPVLKCLSSSRQAHEVGENGIPFSNVLCGALLSLTLLSCKVHSLIQEVLLLLLLLLVLLPPLLLSPLLLVLLPLLLLVVVYSSIDGRVRICIRIIVIIIIIIIIIIIVTISIIMIINEVPLFCKLKSETRFQAFIKPL